MERKPTESEIREFTKVRKWTVRHPGTGERITEECSFAQMEHKWFEGFNIISRVGFYGAESFKRANERMNRYYELDYESKVKLREAGNGT